LSFEQDKPHNVSLIAGLKAILNTLEYNAEPDRDITMVIFQLGILLKRLKFLTTEDSDDQLLREVIASTKVRDVKKCFPSLK